MKELKENYPESALVLDSKTGKLPDFSDLTYHEVPVNDLEVGSYILVKAGEVCTCKSLFLLYFPCIAKCFRLCTIKRRVVNMVF